MEKKQLEALAQLAGDPGDLRAAASALLSGAAVEDPAVLADLFQRATERLNPLIERAEKALTGLQLNVAACITLEYQQEEYWGRYLGFRKEGREWGLFIDSGTDGDQENWESVRLHSASREQRLEALMKLPELEKALIAEANRQCGLAVRVVAEAATYLSKLETRQP